MEAISQLVQTTAQGFVTRKPKNGAICISLGAMFFLLSSTAFGQDFSCPLPNVSHDPQSINVQLVGSVTEVEQETILSVIKCANNLVPNNLRLPPVVNLRINREISNTGYANLFDILGTVVQFKAPNGNLLKTFADSLPVTAHEYGHLLFGSNLWPKDQELARRLSEISRQRAVLSKGPQSPQAVIEATELRSQFSAALKEIEETEHSLAGPYNELFADLIAVLVFGDGQIMFKVNCFDDPTLDSKHIRDFNFSHPIFSGMGGEVHEVLDPIRSFLGVKISNARTLEDKQRIVAVVYSIFANEIRNRAKRKQFKISPEDLNKHLLAKLRKAV